MTDMTYRRFAVFLEQQCGIVLGAGKQYLVNSRLQGLMPKFHATSIDELISRAIDGNETKIVDDIVEAMTTNETLWFRDTYPYLALEKIILPELAVKDQYPVKIWSAACSSGQEPYSIAMVILEQLGRMVHVDPSRTQIIATDLSNEMLTQGRMGLYDAHALSRGLSAERKAKFFKATRNPNLMKIDSRVKALVTFRTMNLLGSFALMGKFDIIFCRNVLIYFSNDIKAQILNKFDYCLNPGGYLILGSTESITGATDKFDMVRCHPGIIYKKRGKF